MRCAPGIVLIALGWFAGEAVAQAPPFESGVLPDLSNVRNADEFRLAPAVQDAVVRNGFGIDRGKDLDFYPIYLGERYPFVTSDAMLHAYYLLYSEALSQMEERVFLPALADLHGRLNRAAASALRGDPAWDRTAAHVAVAARLLDPLAEVDPGIADVVAAELARIDEASGPAPSPLWTREIDYSTFRVRGTYARSERRSRYFRCLTWHHRVLFRLASEEETRDALRLSGLLAADAEGLAAWREIDAWVSWFVGPPDDPDPAAYLRLAAEVGGDLRPADVAGRPDLLRGFRERAAALPPPAICGEVLTPGRTPAFPETTRGFRFFSERRTPTGALFQEVLLARDGFPSGLDLAATLLDWPRARMLLEATARPALPPRDLASIRAAAGGPRPVHHEIELLHVLSSLARPAQAHDPAFLRSPAWQDKTLNSALGAWVEAQHAIALHTKDANLYMGMSGRFPRFPGWVEPVPEFYSRLGALAAETLRRLEGGGVFERLAAVPPPARAGSLPGEVSAAHFRRLIGLLEGLNGIAIAQQEQRPLSFEQRKLLERFGDELKQLAFNVSNSDEPREDIAKVVDLATEFEARTCLETAIGRVFPIYVIVPSVYGPMLCRGGVYSYYEFLHPVAERLTDESWRAMVARGGPEAEPWVAGKGLGVRAWAELPLTLEDVHALERQVVARKAGPAVPGEDPASRRVDFPWHRPVPPECAPALLALATAKDAPTDLARFVAEALREWDDPRATQFFARAVEFKARKDPAADYPTSIDYPASVGTDHPLFGAPPSDIALLGSLMAGYVRRSTAADLPGLRELWRQYSVQGLYHTWVCHVWDPVSDAIADGLGRLDPAGSLRTFESDLREAGSVCQGFRQLHRRLGSEAFPLLDRVIRSAPEPVLIEAMAVLADSNDPEARRTLRRLCDTGSLEVRFAAAQAWFGIGPGRDEDPDHLLFAGRENPDPLSALDGGVDREEAESIIAGLLRTRRPPGLSRQYAGWIAIAGRLRVARVGEEVAALVAEEAALGEFGRVCRAGVAALGAIGREPGVAALRSVAGALEREPADRHTLLRCVLASSMVLRGLPEVAEWLPGLVAREDLEWRLRFGLLQGLDSVESPLAAEVLRRVAEHPLASEKVLQEIRELRARRAGPPSHRPETDAVRTRLESIEEALGRGDIDAALSRFLEEPGSRERRVLLVEVGASSAVRRNELLSAIARHPEVEVRSVAVDSAQAPGFGPATAGEVLEAALGDPDRALALRAADRLARLGDEGQRILFQAMMSEASPWRRTLGAIGLSHAGWGEAGDLLARSLEDSDPWVRTAAAVALVVCEQGMLTDATAAALIPAAEGADPALRDYVRLGLEGWAQRVRTEDRDPRWERILRVEGSKD